MSPIILELLVCVSWEHSPMQAGDSGFLLLVLGWYPLTIMCWWSLMSYSGSKTCLTKATNIIMVPTRIRFLITPLLSAWHCGPKIGVGEGVGGDLMYPTGSLRREYDFLSLHFFPHGFILFKVFRMWIKCLTINYFFFLSTIQTENSWENIYCASVWQKQKYELATFLRTTKNTFFCLNQINF